MTPTATMYFTIIISAIISLLLVYFLRKPTAKNVTTAPSILTGIGIFGTFLGVAIGLMHFDATDVVAGVPIFLSGIKLAFWSSVVGIFASLIHKVRFTLHPYEEEFADDEMAVSTVASLQDMTKSLSNIEKHSSNDSRDRAIDDIGGFLRTFGEKLEAGLLDNKREEPEFVSVSELNVDEAVLLELQNLREQLNKNSAQEQELVSGHIQRLLDEVKEDTAASGRQTESLLNALSELKDNSRSGGDEVLGAFRQLSEELANNSLRQSESMLEAVAGLKEYSKAEDEAVLGAFRELKDDLAAVSAKNSESILQAFGGLKNDLGAGSERDREISKEQMEALFSGLTQAASGTLGELTELADNVVSQGKWQAANLARELTAANEISAKSMIAMLKEILGATEDANFKITTELAKLRGDVAADLKVSTEQASSLVEQLHAMTESYKASLIATVTDLKTQITKDMKSNYNMVETYTKAVADVTGTNQAESLERMEAIANIMQNVVQSSSDMSSLLHDNAAAMTRMQEAFTGTNEGSLGRFLLNMNDDLIEHITELQNSLDAQGSLGTLMQDMNAETNVRLRELEKAFEGSVFEIKQLPMQFVKGMTKFNSNGRKN